MSKGTQIQWTRHTYNPWRGCTKVSEGCKLCYAETLSNRNPKVLGVWGPAGTRVLAARQQWQEPIKWDQEARSKHRQDLVFCASVADVFEVWEGPMQNSQGMPLWWHPDWPPDYHGYPTASHFLPDNSGCKWMPFSLKQARSRLWDLIRATPHLIWQLLTKRPENVLAMMPWGDWPNVWLGASVENQSNAWRLNALQEASVQVRVPVLFCSAEPLLGPLDLYLSKPSPISWVIVGGESGSAARPMHLEWARDILEQCRQADVACFVKQLGHRPTTVFTSTGQRLALPLVDRKGGSMEEWPANLQVRQFPAGYVWQHDEEISHAHSGLA